MSQWFPAIVDRRSVSTIKHTEMKILAIRMPPEWRKRIIDAAVAEQMTVRAYVIRKLLPDLFSGENDNEG